MENFYDFLNGQEQETKRIVGMYLQSPKMAISEIARSSKLGWGIKEIAEFTGYSTRNIRYILKDK